MATRVKSLAAFKPKVEDFVITNSANGEEYIVSLREMKYSEIAALRNTMAIPKPTKIKGFKGKDPLTGQPIPEYDDNDPEYRKALSKYNEDWVYEWLILALVEPKIPGEAHEDKMNALRENIPNWVFIELQKRLNEASGFQMSEAAFAKKKLKEMKDAT